MSAPHHPDPGAYDDKSEQRADARHFPHHRKRQKSRKRRHKQHEQKVGAPRCTELRVDVGEYFGYQSIARHGEKYAALSQKHHQHDGSKSANDAELDQNFQPFIRRLIDRHRNRRRRIELGVMHHAGQNVREQDVQNSAHNQGANNADRHILLGILGLLGSRRDRVESNIGEEDDTRAHHDSAHTKLSKCSLILRDERLVILGMDVLPANSDKDHHHGELDHHNDRIGPGGFFNADDQQQRDHANNKYSGQIYDSLDRSSVRQHPHFKGPGQKLLRKIDAEIVQQRK